MKKYYMPELKSFGQAIKYYRLKAALSQEQLADNCGLHRTYVGSVERGERNTGLINIFTIAKALGISASKLITKAEQIRAKQK